VPLFSDTAKMPPINRKHHYWVLLRSLLTIAILCYVFTIIPFNQVLESLQSASQFHILLAVGILFGTTLVSAWRLKICTDKQGLSLSVKQITEINLITSFYGLLLPGLLASGVIRWHRISQVDKKKAEALAAILFSRINFTMVLVLVGIVCLALGTDNRAQTLFISSLLILLVSLIIVYFLAFHPFLLWFSDRLKPGEAGFLSAYLRDGLSRWLSAMSLYEGLPHIALGLITTFSFLENVLGVLFMYFLALGLHIDIHLIIIGWVRSLINIATTLPISFSGLGIREGGLILLLKPYGVSGSEAVALAFLIYFCNLFLGLIGGLLEARNFLFGSKSKGIVCRD